MSGTNRRSRVICEDDQFNIWLKTSNFCFSIDGRLFGATYIGPTYVNQSEPLVEKEYLKTALKSVVYLPNLFGKLFLKLAYLSDPKLEAIQKDIVHLSRNADNQKKIKGLFYHAKFDDLKLIDLMASSENPSLTIDMLPLKRQCSIIYHPRFINTLKHNLELCAKLNASLKEQILSECYDDMVVALSQAHPSVDLSFRDNKGLRLDSYLDLSWIFEQEYRSELKQLLEQDLHPDSAINKKMEIYATYPSNIPFTDEIKIWIYLRMETYMEEDPSYLKKYIKENSQSIIQEDNSTLLELSEGAQCFIDSFFVNSLRKNSDPKEILRKFKFYEFNFSTNLSPLTKLDEIEFLNLLPCIAVGEDRKFPFKYSLDSLFTEYNPKIVYAVNQYLHTCLENKEFCNAFFNNPKFCSNWDWSHIFNLFENEPIEQKSKKIIDALDQLCEEAWNNDNLREFASNLIKSAYDYPGIIQDHLILSGALCYLVPYMEKELVYPLSKAHLKRIENIVSVMHKNYQCMYNSGFAPTNEAKIDRLCGKFCEINIRECRDMLFRDDVSVKVLLRQLVKNEWDEKKCISEYNYLHKYLELSVNPDDSTGWWLAPNLSRHVFSRLFYDDAFIDSIEDNDFMRILFFLALCEDPHAIDYILLPEGIYESLHGKPTICPPLKTIINHFAKKAIKAF